MKIKNPFLIYGYAGPEYFCDREEETSRLASALQNGRNVTLMSPRRMGKTGLIHNVFDRLQRDGGDVVCVYLDVFATRCQSDFVSMLGRAVVSRVTSLSQKALASLGSILKSCKLVFSADPLSGAPQVGIDFNPQQADNTLKEIFDYLKQSPYECFIAIDEFQQIAEYPETGLEASLRSYAQFCPNVHFVFSGSRQHLMSEIFDSPKRPFFRSTQKMAIGPIPEKSYYLFAADWMSKAGITLPQEVFGELYAMFEGHTWYVQNVLNHLYEYHPEQVSRQVLTDCIAEIVQSEEEDFKRHLNLLTANQCQLLRAIGRARCVAAPNAIAFIHAYGLKGASSINKALTYLLQNEYVYHSEKGYIVYDRFMGLWLERDVLK